MVSGIPDETWVEVICISVLDDDAGLFGFLWFWMAMGSGVLLAGCTLHFSFILLHILSGGVVRPEMQDSRGHPTKV